MGFIVELRVSTSYGLNAFSTTDADLMATVDAQEERRGNECEVDQNYFHPRSGWSK
jgi:hypothetical protein